MFVLFTFLMTLAHYKNQNTLILRIGSVYCFCEQNNTHKKRQMICFYLLERNNSTMHGTIVPGETIGHTSHPLNECCRLSDDSHNNDSAVRLVLLLLLLWWRSVTPTYTHSLIHSFYNSLSVYARMCLFLVLFVSEFE